MSCELIYSLAYLFKTFLTNQLFRKLVLLLCQSSYEIFFVKMSVVVNSIKTLSWSNLSDSHIDPVTNTLWPSLCQPYLYCLSNYKDGYFPIEPVPLSPSSTSRIHTTKSGI